MTDQEIERIALANGFKLKQQPSGMMALNPYVYSFARALLAAKDKQGNFVSGAYQCGANPPTAQY